jgi:AraC family transcriptional regulator
MVVPESDWTNAPPNGVENFQIRRSVNLRQVNVDIRRYRWISRQRGPILPQRHYLDFSLDLRLRRSCIHSDHWAKPRFTGDMLYLPPDQVYFGETACQDRNLLCIGVGKDFFEQIFEDQGGSPEMIPCVDVQSPTMRRLLTGLAGELSAPGFATDAFVQSILVLVTIELSRCLYRGPSIASDPAGLIGRRFHRASEFIADNIEKELNIGDIAGECGISPRHLTRIFKSETGMTLGGYVAQCRIAVAKDMLRSSPCQIKVVAFRCGFQNPSAFSAAFHAATGVTPRAFRKCIQG